ncbi:retrovirus-related pol polyprotein from transposon TNT 1-94, partial [Trifolium medium]|nr:retrovirus-related pol polyprotein from transposon TNT 1-94 [Trifolium medium]
PLDNATGTSPIICPSPTPSDLVTSPTPTPASLPPQCDTVPSLEPPQCHGTPPSSLPPMPTHLPVKPKKVVHNSTNIHPLVIRCKKGNLKPKVFLDDREPISVKQALSDPKWLTAMQAEYSALMNNKTWSLVPLPTHIRAIGCKWVFRIKENLDGTVNKYKAHLMAKRFNQEPGFDFQDTFSPVVKPVTIRII